MARNRKAKENADMADENRDLATSASDIEATDKPMEQGGDEPRELQHTAEQPLTRAGGVDVTINSADPSSGATSAVNTQGMDVSASAAKIKEIEAELRKRQMERLDPVTNQPYSDFFPDLANLDERSQEMAYDAIKTTAVAGRGQYAMGMVDARDRAEERHAAAVAAMKEVEASNPLPKEAVGQLDPATYRARMFARNQAEARTLRSNTVEPGGKYLVDGRWVDAFGNPVKA